MWRGNNVSGLYRSAGAFDLDDRLAQLHCERTEQVETACAIAGLAGELQRGGCGAYPRRADCLGGALEFVGSGRQGGKVAGARGNLDLVLGTDRRVTKCAQQRIDGGAIAAEPVRKDIAVERSDRLVLVRRREGVALTLDRQ